ncbi:hypothetical protein AYO21_04661 [Fonsecaea monophora]|uniref:BZIP domain-containing protein n=1 Tax=Fonsecaea monophora TaxID=254056 RepID=A0A177FA80_9EURO|nr:hypothetical protein AYO21_04661 [Fonsecaea monophora]OAG41048.1 hypothetical protein AYO21_04661 [Fonsecaea monophora]
MTHTEDDGFFDVTLLSHPMARSIDELWAGKTDIKERRRLQNRLNRRAYRKRQVEQKLLRERTMNEAGPESQKGRHHRASRIPGVGVFALAEKDSVTSDEPISLSSLVSAAGKLSTGANKIMSFESSTLSRGHQINLKLVQSWCRRFEESMLGAGSVGVEFSDEDAAVTDSDPVVFEESIICTMDIRYHTFIPNPEDQLLNLMYYNVFRGLARNIRALNMEMHFMSSWASDSPFVTGQIDISTLPPDFQPTYLQRTVSHHPCFDIFPDPVVRDNAIEHWHTWHEIDLALRHGCVLWGEPDVAESWEVTQGFADDWPFLVKGAFRLEAATNRYRALRGEPPIFFAFCTFKRYWHQGSTESRYCVPFVIGKEDFQWLATTYLTLLSAADFLELVSPTPHFHRASNQVYALGPANRPADVHDGAGSDTYRTYSGDGSTSSGWPEMAQWVSFEDMVVANENIMRVSFVNLGPDNGPDNSNEEISQIWNAVQSVLSQTNVDHRFILAILLQESNGCVRVRTTKNGVRNPGLTQAHDGGFASMETSRLRVPLLRST